MRGGASQATKTTKHQEQTSAGMMVCGGRRHPVNAREETPESHSGTIQLKRLSNGLQDEVMAVVNTCIEEAFGKVWWFKATKDAFQKVPSSHHLPNSTRPASDIWWNQNNHASKTHIDENTVLPCFVLTPNTHDGAELSHCTSEN